MPVDPVFDGGPADALAVALLRAPAPPVVDRDAGLRAAAVRDRVAVALSLVVPARLALDLCWPWSVGPVSAPQLGSGLLFVGLSALVLARWRRALTHPWRVPMGLFAAMV